jgi:4-hydroxy-L-threonine phosphate dehydrogenase PdxA
MHLKTKENTKIAITMGDLSGIGPELIIRTFEDPRMLNQFTPVIYGSVKAINFYRRLLNIEKFNSMIPLHVPKFQNSVIPFSFFNLIFKKHGYQSFSQNYSKLN